MGRAIRFIGQTAAYLVVAALLGYFSNSPAFTYFPRDRALVRLAFDHVGERKEKCHQLTAAEQAKLAPNMRKKFDCSRERMPIYVELLVDDGILYRATRTPTGLAGDGPSKVYERFSVFPGSHHIVVRMRDSDRTEGYDFETSGDVTLLPTQNFVIGFEKETGGFKLGNDGGRAIQPR